MNEAIEIIGHELKIAERCLDTWEKELNKDNTETYRALVYGSKREVKLLQGLLNKLNKGKNEDELF